MWGYADALSAANLGEEAARDFQSFMQTARKVTTPETENQIRIEYAGLLLMAGNSAPVGEFAEKRQGISGTTIPPETMSRLGWWYYRAGKYSDAEALLRRLTRERPGDGGLQNNLAWVELEDGKFDAAIRRFKSAEGRGGLEFNQWNTPQMGEAIAQWKLHRVDDALKNYEPAATNEPQWTNPPLVRAFYSPQVAQSVAEMQAEQSKRQEARKRKSMGKP